MFELYFTYSKLRFRDGDFGTEDFGIGVFGDGRGFSYLVLRFEVLWLDSFELDVVGDVAVRGL